MDQARALLDSLMGPSRDAKRDKSKVGQSFLDKNVCKYHLVGFCPVDHMDNYFRGKECNKRGVQECCKIHSDATRAEFEQHPEYERYRDTYEKDYLSFLDKLIADADAIIRREKPLARPLTPQVRLKDAASAEVQRWEEEIQELMKKSEQLAEEGLMQQSKDCLEKARVNQRQIDMKKESCTYLCGEEVCDVCGLRFVVGDSREDKTNSETHRRSRMHTGYQLVRDKADEVRARLRERAREKEKEKEAERAREREQREQKEQKEQREPREQREQREVREQARQEEPAPEAKRSSAKRSSRSHNRSRRSRSRSRRRSARSRSRRRRSLSRGRRRSRSRRR